MATNQKVKKGEIGFNTSIPPHIPESGRIIRKILANGHATKNFCGSVILETDEYSIAITWEKPSSSYKKGRPHIAILTKDQAGQLQRLMMEHKEVMDENGILYTDWDIDDTNVPEVTIGKDVERSVRRGKN